MDRVYKLIKLNRLIRSHRVKFALALAAHHFKMRHLFLRFDPVMACNLRCTMCYFSSEEYRRKVAGIFKEEDIERIAKLLFPKTIQLVIGCGTEPTLYRNYSNIIKTAKAYGVPFVGFTSNGMLLTQESLGKFVEYGLDELALSVHGVKKQTYERFMVQASFDKLLSVLETLDSEKKRRKARNPKLRINYTVNSENIDELTGFFDVFGHYGISTLQIRPVMDIGGQYRTPLQAMEHDKYKSTLGRLQTECKRRGITFLANTADPSYEHVNYDSLILEAVKRYISPEVVWRKDFDWKHESYEEFCRRIGWSSFLLKGIVSSKDALAARNTTISGRYAARYEVTF